MGDDCILGLLPNKSDIMFFQPELREVLKEQADLIARDFGLIFVEESSAKINKGIDEFFDEITEHVFQK